MVSEEATEKLSPTIHVVEVDTSKFGSSSMIQGYTERSCSAEYWETKILNNRQVVEVPIPIAKMCGLDLKLYISKSKCKVGVGKHYSLGGEMAVVQFLTMNPGFLSDNNGAASFLIVDPKNGLPYWKMAGKVYIVQGDGTSKLTRGQVWGLQEMIHCSMDIYDMDPENIRLGRETLERWAREYRMGTWEPQSGTGGVDIYGIHGLGL